MKKLFRSAAVLALAAALLVSLTACGKEQETQPETEEPSDTEDRTLSASSTLVSSTSTVSAKFASMQASSSRLTGASGAKVPSP